MKKTFLLLPFLILCFSGAFSQTTQPGDNKQKAHQLQEQAIHEMDNGDYDGSIPLLESAQKLDPDDHSYLYGIGYAYMLKRDYRSAIHALQKTLDYPDVTDQCYQMLGNAYDKNDQRARARDTYTAGIIKFPSSGRLYMESGAMDLMEKHYKKAALNWEKGIQVQPEYPANYYRLAKLFSETPNRIWTIFYGELFMNLERDTHRTDEMSKLVFDAYNASISFPNAADGVKLDMASNVAPASSTGRLTTPFHIAFSTAFLTNLAPVDIGEGDKDVNIAMLSQARIALIDFWFGQKQDNEQFPNVLLDFHRTLKEKGMLEAYNYWLLMKGRQREYTQWQDTHRDQVIAFAAWFKDNPLKLDTSHYFVRTQYD